MVMLGFLMAIFIEREMLMSKEDYLHLNWGWNGNSNGYYLAGIFNGGEGPTFPSTRAAGKGNYPYNVEIIPYINIIK